MPSTLRVNKPCGSKIQCPNFRIGKVNLANLVVAGADLAEADLKGSDLNRAILAEPIPKID